MSLVGPAWIFLGLITVGACKLTAPSAPKATVRFMIDAPLCSSIIPVQFSIDRVLVGTDTFFVDVAPREHLTSRDFAVSVGQHVLGARLSLRGSFDSGKEFPDKTVNLAAGATVTDSLPFYCS